MAQVSQLLDDTLGDNIDFVDINCGEGLQGKGGVHHVCAKISGSQCSPLLVLCLSLY
jgi:hypothetical protein